MMARITGSAWRSTPGVRLVKDFIVFEKIEETSVWWWEWSEFSEDEGRTAQGQDSLHHGHGHLSSP